MLLPDPSLFHISFLYFLRTFGRLSYARTEHIVRPRITRHVTYYMLPRYSLSFVAEHAAAPRRSRFSLSAQPLLTSPPSVRTLYIYILVYAYTRTRRVVAPPQHHRIHVSPAAITGPRPTVPPWHPPVWPVSRLLFFTSTTVVSPPPSCVYIHILLLPLHGVYNMYDGVLNYRKITRCYYGRVECNATKTRTKGATFQIDRITRRSRLVYNVCSKNLLQFFFFVNTIDFRAVWRRVYQISKHFPPGVIII